MIHALVTCLAVSTAMPTAIRQKAAPSKKDVVKVKVRRIEQLVPTSTTAPPPKNAVVGVHNIVVVMVETDDAKFNDPTAKEKVEKLFFDQQEPSLAHYYQEQSYGRYVITGKVFGPVRIRGSIQQFAYGPGKPGDAVRPLITGAFDQTAPQIDMKVFDGYNQFSEAKPDGAVDHFAIIFPQVQPGHEGHFKPIWPHRGTLDHGTAKKLKSYYIFPFPTPLGTLAHEHGHDIGMPDLYDRDDSSYGVGPWCLMASGSWLGEGNMPGHVSAWGKVAMGWVRPRVIAHSQERVEIAAVETSPTVLKIPIHKADGNEFFLVENRQRIGYDAQLPDEGLLVWHIDQGVKHNDDEQHKFVDLVEPAAVQDLDQMLRDANPDLLDTFRAGKKSRFADDTTPSSKDYTGQSTGVIIDDISASKSVMLASFNVPSITMPEGEPFTLVRDNYTFGAFGAVPLGSGSESLMPLQATEGAFDMNEIELLLMARPRAVSRLTINIYDESLGRPRASYPAELRTKDDSYGWLKVALPETLRIGGNKKFWIGVVSHADQLAVAYNPDSLSKEARFRKKPSDSLATHFNFRSGKEPVADFIVRAKGYGFIGVQNPKIPEQAPEGDELIKRMREADQLLDKKKFLEASALYDTVLQRMAENPRPYITWIPVVINALGVANYQAKNYKGAIDLFTRTLRYAQMMGDPRAEADVLENIGETHFHAGNLALAEQFCSRASAMNKDDNERLLESEYWLGRILYGKRGAAEHFDAAEKLVAQIHKGDEASKWSARIARARAGKAKGEDPIDGESRLAGELKEERKAEAATDAPEESGDQRGIDLGDFGIGGGSESK